MRSPVGTLLVGTILLAACGGESKEVAVSATTVGGGEASTTSVIDLPASVGQEWDLVEPVPFDAGAVADVGSDGHRVWVAAGSPVRLYASGDGRAWDEVELEPAGWPADRCASPDGVPNAVVAAADDRVVLACLAPVNPGTDPSGRFGEVWVWQRSDAGDEVAGPTTPGLDQAPPDARNFRIQRLQRVASSADGVVVIGAAQFWAPYETGDSSFLALTSDGTTWRQFSVSDGPLGGQGWEVAADLVVTGRGPLVVGSDESRFVTWTSGDGSTWSPTAPDLASPLGLQRPLAVAAGPDGIVVAAGIDEAPVPSTDRRPAVWRSVDGSTWEHVDLPATDLFEPSRIVWAADRFFLVGHGDVEGRSIWTSTDGTTWEPGPENITLSWLVPAGEALVGIGPAGVFVSG